MMAIWMLSVVLLTAWLGMAAACGETALRALGRQARWPWLAALATGFGWPVGAALIRWIAPSAEALASSSRLPSFQVVPSMTATVGAWPARTNLVLVLLWAVGTAVVSVRALRALALLRRIRLAATPAVVDGIPVLVSETVGPAVVGVIGPQVLLPHGLLALERPLRRLVLQHEAEHCRARDQWIVVGSTAALSLMPWNVPLWWIARRARLAMEIDCDARVLASGADAGLYGRLLLFIAQRQMVTRLAPMLAASTSHLERRIIAMRAFPSRWSRLRLTLALAGAAIGVVAACTSRVGDDATNPRTPAVSSTVGREAAAPVRVGADQPMREFQVEQQVRMIPEAANVPYPDALRSAKVEGEVLAQFVVDADGSYAPGTLKILKSSHPLFTTAVSNALPTMHFVPAEIGGRKVRQLVQQPFTFAMAR